MYTFLDSLIFSGAFACSEVNGMAVQLFEHNQRAYLSVESMLSNVGKAAVIHPTETGKAILLSKLLRTTRMWNASPSKSRYMTVLSSLNNCRTAFLLLGATTSGRQKSSIRKTTT